MAASTPIWPAEVAELMNAPVLSMSDDEEPLFQSVHAALMFAYHFTHGTLKQNALARLQGGRSGKGLAGLDGASQAGMVKAAVDTLSDLHRSVIVARFAPKSVPCDCRRACCRGWLENPEWSQAVAWLTEHVLIAGLTGTVSHYRFRRALVARYLGEKVQLQEIAARCDVDRDTVGHRYAKVQSYFGGKPPSYRGVEWQAMAAIEGKLKETSGLI